MIKKINKLYILWPSGNTTALVEDKIPRPSRALISKRIMKIKPVVEQVGFIEKTRNKKAAARLQMMGGEFCGNATRCLGWLLLEGKPGKIKLEVSGSKNLLTVVINKQGGIKAEMPIKSSLNSVKKFDKFWLVSLYGITYIISEDSIEKDRKRKFASEILSKFHLKRRKAAGVLFIKKRKNKIFMDPFVWVKRTETFLNETACASGTAAIGLYQAKSKNKSIKNLEVIQPSGESIFTIVERDNLKFKNAWIEGSVKLIYKGSLTLSKTNMKCYHQERRKDEKN